MVPKSCLVTKGDQAFAVWAPQFFKKHYIIAVIELFNADFIVVTFILINFFSFLFFSFFNSTALCNLVLSVLYNKVVVIIISVFRKAVSVGSPNYSMWHNNRKTSTLLT